MGWEIPTPTKFILPLPVVIVQVRKPVPTKVFTGSLVVLEKPSFQEKTRFQFVDVYTKIAAGCPSV